MLRILSILFVLMTILYVGSSFAADGGILMIVSSEGAVLVKPASSERWVEAKPGMWLKKGDIIKTGLDGQAYLQFTEKNGFTLMPDSQIAAGDGPLIAEPYSEPPSRTASESVDNIYAPAVMPEQKASSV